MRRFVSLSLVAAAVFATGAAGLVYQVVWDRYLARLLGSDHLATALVLAVFLGGLSAGYVLCGRWTARVHRHLLVYALIEGGIGLWALLFPALFRALESIARGWSFAPPWGLLIQGSILAALLVLPPTLLMGATVPFLTRALATERAQPPRVLAAVYGLNTAGAVAGALLAGFVLLPAFGLSRTILGTSVVSLLSGALLVAASVLERTFARSEDIAAAATPVARTAHAMRTAIAATTTNAATTAPTAPTTAVAPPITTRTSIDLAPSLSRAAIPLVGFLNGAAVLGLEAIVIRFAKLVLGGSSYTFSSIVAVFVLALAVGSGAVARARRIDRRVLPFTQGAAAVWLFAVYLSLDRWPYWAHVVRIGFQAGDVGFALHQATLFVLFNVLLLPPVALLGVTVPLLFAEIGADVASSGREAGRLLAWNGLGCLLGSLAGGYLLFGVMDAGRVFLVPGLLAALIAIVAVVAPSVGAREAGTAGTAGEYRPRARLAGSLPARAAVFALAALYLVAILVRPLYDPTRLALGTFRNREPAPFSLMGATVFYRELYGPRRVLAQEDDPVASIAILEESTTAADGRRSLALVSNGKSESDTVSDAATLRLLAHLPALWSARRERVLLVGLGTGVTAGEIALYPDVQRIDVAEISPAVVRALPRFAAFTHDVQKDPRLTVHLEDALMTLRRARGKWNIIVSEPSNPWVSGADLLFTKEYYELVRARLEDDGLFLQWLNIYEADSETLAIALNTVTSVFPTLHVFRGTEGDLLLMASGRVFTAEDRRRADATLERLPDVRASLAEIGIESTSQLLAREVATLPTLLRQGARYGINTMDRPRLHYLAGKAMFSGTRVTEDMLRGTTNLDFLFEPPH